MRLVWATVRAIDDADAEIQRMTVGIDDGSSGRAVSYIALTGACSPDDRVLLNTTAVDLDLGTGGAHFVVAREASGSGVTFDRASGGHVLKLRYTPLQVDVIAVESPESPHHGAMLRAESLEGMPVVCCGLHSQVPLVAAAIKHADPALRVAYCMTDQAALCLPLSELMRASSAAGLIDGTISCGQAFGGEYEAVNLFSGLLAARHVLAADVAIVAIGPGVVGTSTPFGHGGVAQGEAINAVAALDGVPVACLRVSFADARERHTAVSHHTLSALSRVALAPAIVAVPGLPEEFLHAIEARLDSAGIWKLHRRADSPVYHTTAPDLRGIRVTTMGRGIIEDPAFFSAAFAAGDIAFRVARLML